LEEETASAAAYLARDAAVGNGKVVTATRHDGRERCSSSSEEIGESVADGSVEKCFTVIDDEQHRPDAGCRHVCR